MSLQISNFPASSCWMKYRMSSKNIGAKATLLKDGFIAMYRPQVTFLITPVHDSVHGGGGGVGANTRLGRHPPPRDGHCSGRYASYWNAFLFNLLFTLSSDKDQRKKLAFVFAFDQCKLTLTVYLYISSSDITVSNCTVSCAFCNTTRNQMRLTVSVSYKSSHCISLRRKFFTNWDELPFQELLFTYARTQTLSHTWST